MARHAGHAAGLAPPTDHTPMDIPQPAGSPADQPGDPRTGAATSAGEPGLGIPQSPWQAMPPGPSHQRGDGAADPARPAGTALPRAARTPPGARSRNDNRRQVIVESDDDENCYNELFRLLKDRIDSPISLDFIASGKGGQGNVDAVIRLVQSLRKSGNLIRGLVDRDDRQSAPDGIEFLKGRRSLENLLLDPFLVGVFLLREHIVRPEAITGETVMHFNLPTCAGNMRLCDTASHASR